LASSIADAPNLQASGQGFPAALAHAQANEPDQAKGDGGRLRDRNGAVESNCPEQGRSCSRTVLLKGAIWEMSVKWFEAKGAISAGAVEGMNLKVKFGYSR
jgi:hypothetical protein